MQFDTAKITAIITADGISHTPDAGSVVFEYSLLPMFKWAETGAVKRAPAESVALLSF